MKFLPFSSTLSRVPFYREGMAKSPVPFYTSSLHSWQQGKGHLFLPRKRRGSSRSRNDGQGEGIVYCCGLSHINIFFVLHFLLLILLLLVVDFLSQPAIFTFCASSWDQKEVSSDMVLLGVLPCRILFLNHDSTYHVDNVLHFK